MTQANTTKQVNFHWRASAGEGQACSWSSQPRWSPSNIKNIIITLTMSVCITGQIGSGSHCSSYPPQILPEKTKKSRAPFLSRLVSYVYICTCVPQAIECGKSGFAILRSVGAFAASHFHPHQSALARRLQVSRYIPSKNVRTTDFHFWFSTICPS